VETVAAVEHNALERAREVRLAERLARLVRHAVPGERGDAGGIALHGRQHAGERAGEAGHDGEAVARAADGGPDQLAPGPGGVALVREREAGDRAGHAHRQVAVVVDARGVLARRVQEHLRVRAERRLLAEVEARGAAVREADHDESAAADVAGRGVRDGEREAGRDRGVQRVAAGGEHLLADAAGDLRRGDDHAAGRADGRGGRVRRGTGGRRRLWRAAAAGRERERGQQSRREQARGGAAGRSGLEHRATPFRFSSRASRAWTYAWVRRSARHVATRAARAATTSSRASSFRLSPGAAHVVKRLEAGGEVAERG